MGWLNVRDLHKSFVTPTGREVAALRGVSFEMEKGSVLSVIGHNGSGKTTLLNCLRREFPCDRGEVLIGGHPLQSARVNVVSVFQDVGLGVVASMTPIENLSLVFSHERSYRWSFPERRYRNRIYKWLDDFDIRSRFASYENTPASDLSAGQKQQLAIIMALMQEPDVLLLDEFASNLDPAIKSDMMVWLKRWVEEHGVTTISVTHDHAAAEEWGDLVLELEDGKPLRFCRSSVASRGAAK